MSAARHRGLLLQVARYDAAIENSARVRDVRERGVCLLPNFVRVKRAGHLPDRLMTLCRNVFGSAAASELAGSGDGVDTPEAVVARLVGRMTKSDVSARDVHIWMFTDMGPRPMASDDLMDRLDEQATGRGEEDSSERKVSTKAVFAGVTRRARAVLRDRSGGK
jgi:hypothetical protein